MNVYKVTYEFYVDVGESGTSKTAEEITDRITNHFDYEDPVFEKVHMILQKNITKPRKLPYTKKSKSKASPTSEEKGTP